MRLIPRSPDEFTTGWLEHCFKAPAGSLKTVATQAIGDGHIAGSYRIEMDWHEANGPASAVIKCQHPGDNRFVARDLWMYRREVGWYQDLASRSDIRCPRCYFAAINDDGGEFVLLLEDCAPATQGDQLLGESLDFIRKGVSEMALLHQPFWNDSALTKYPYLAFERDFRPKKAEMTQALWVGFKERYASRLSADYFELGDAFFKKLERFICRETDTNTLTHNDIRIDNMLYSQVDDRVIILDWQTMGVGNPMNDLSYFIGTSFVDAKQRRQEEPALFQAYIAQLEAMGVQVEPEALWAEYRVQAFAGVVQAVLGGMSVARSERGDEMFAVMTERPLIQAMDLDSLSLL